MPPEEPDISTPPKHPSITMQRLNWTMDWHQHSNNLRRVVLSLCLWLAVCRCVYVCVCDCSQHLKWCGHMLCATSDSCLACDSDRPLQLGCNATQQSQGTTSGGQVLDPINITQGQLQSARCTLLSTTPVSSPMHMCLHLTLPALHHSEGLAIY